MKIDQTFASLVFIAAATTTSFAAAPQPAPAVKAAPLQFDQLGAVKAWRAGGDNIIFVKDRKGQWYKAVLYETCMALDTSKGVKFQTQLNPDNNEKTSKVIVNRHICTVASLDKSEPPPAK